MRYKNLGNTNLKISEIAAGTWGFGGRGWGDADRDKCIKALHALLDLGVNTIDTAPAYGNGSVEELVGEAVKGKRDKLVIATKCGINLKVPYGSGGKRMSATKEEVIEGCEDSLKRLDTDYIDIFFLHWPDPDTHLEETMTAMQSLKDQGKIRHIGVSNFTIPLLEEALKFTSIEVLQPPFSMIDQSARDVMLWANQKNIGSMTYASLGAGLLGGKIREAVKFIEGDFRDNFYSRYFHEPGFSKVMELMKTVDKISESRKVPQSQVAINWAAQKEYVLCALIGVRSEEHAKENCASTAWSLTKEEIASLDAEIERLFID